MAFTNGNDINILQSSDSSVVGAGLGNDRYVLSAATLTANQSITISDTQGLNALQLVGGLVIVSSRVTSNAIQLTLNNGAVITILSADTFTFITGGDGISAAGGLVQSFATFVPQSLRTTIPPAGATPATGGGVVVDSSGGTLPFDGQSILNISLVSSPSQEGNSGSSTYLFRVTRSGDLSGPSSVEYVAQGAGSNPANPSDFAGGVFPSGTVNFLANQFSAVFAITIAGDTVIEPNETFLVNLRNPVGAALGNTVAVAATIVDDDTLAQPVISIQPNGVSAVEGNTGSTLFTFTVTRTGDLSSASTVNFMVEGSGTNAALASDFAGGIFPSGAVTFARDQSTALISVNINGDTLVESTETFAIRLNNPVNAALGNSVSIGTIVNDDNPTVVDDFTANTNTTGVLAVGGTVRGVIETAADKDWFSVNLIQGQTYRISLAREGTTLDPFLKLLSSTGAEIAFNDDAPSGNTLNSEITFTANATDRFFIEAGSFEGETSGAYNVGVTAVSVPENNPSRFDIAIEYTGPQQYRSFFDRAADRLEQIIVGDLASDFFQGRFVDDILISASMVNIDGVGGSAGRAGPNALRAGSLPLPIAGTMEFDIADADLLIAEAGFGGVVVHEMLHALGFGTMWGLPGYGFNSTFGQYRGGANALREYQQIRGTSETFIPLETTGGQGSANSHWQDRLFFGEVMGAFYNTGEVFAISRITTGALQDLGYTVNYAAADPFRFTAAASVAEVQGNPQENGIMLAVAPQSPDLMFF